ncbi:hypothetical protein [Roseicella aquatilis]|uniref:Uncharacterized protein n=1 Tax=Roseicella aquatilis TaxID=2527868 RepID=A0A4V2WK04_9PROT|nr:hypothetical protein [Roseicella aquatilis]TCZ56584.1 hypothetical protein EXY23_19520 [Roseicella aquatilis]
MMRGIATLAALIALIPLLGACQRAAGPAPARGAASAGDSLPFFHLPPLRMRPPSSERPPWLSDPPAVIERIPVPDDGFRANLG